MDPRNAQCRQHKTGEACAGAERYYVADDATELETTFSDIARRMGELRIVD